MIKQKMSEPHDIYEKNPTNQTKTTPKPKGRIGVVGRKYLCNSCFKACYSSVKKYFWSVFLLLSDCVSEVVLLAVKLVALGD